MAPDRYLEMLTIRADRSQALGFGMSVQPGDADVKQKKLGYSIR
jgi:hypothetical protein